MSHRTITLKAPRTSLALLPTHLRFLPRLSTSWNVRLYVKHDDQSGTAMTGNKVRKLEFLLADALEKKVRHVVTCGFANSNHCRSTAVACAMLGFQCHLVLPTDDPSKPPQLPDGNLLFGTLCGSHLHWMAMSEYSEGANAAMQKVADQLGSEGSYVIPMGGSNALGVCGYVVAGLELLDQYALQPQHMAHKNAAPSYLYVAVGTGGTFAGLLIAAKIRGLELGKKVHFRGILVKGSVQEQKHSVLKLCADFYDSYPDAVLGGQIPRVSEGDFELFEDFVGPGYAKAYDEDFEVIEEAARTEGVMLDPVYTGKAFTGLRTHVRSGLVPPNSTVVFVHTGGSYGWFQRSHLEKYAEYAHSEPQREEHV